MCNGKRTQYIVQKWQNTNELQLILGGTVDMAKKWVYLFTEGNANMRELLGGKGANLAEMTNIGLPRTAGIYDHDRSVYAVL